VKTLDTIVLAGGRGTRLHSVVKDRQKVVALVDGRPFLDIIVETLKSSGVTARLIFAAGHMAEQVVELYKDRPDLPFEVDFSIEKELLGTGGGIKKALGLTGTENVFVLNGDSFVDVDLVELSEKHAERDAMLTMTIVRVEDAGRFGRVTFDGSGRVVAFEEKKNDGQGGYINAGVYVVNRKVFDGVAADTVISLERDIMPALLPKGVYAFEAKGKFIDIGTPESYNSAHEILKRT
jgi:D-glycero-alpha-D-manno-heptose 1-phosphate guanylyltransferase